jgi:hypothetical protein
VSETRNDAQPLREQAVATAGGIAHAGGDPLDRSPVATRVELRIERLVVDGLPTNGWDASRFQRMLEAELGRLVAAGDLPALLLADGSYASVLAPPVRLSAPLAPAALGSAVAGAVYDGLRQ